MFFSNNTMAFDKRQTNIAKGIAVLFMLYHHLFFDTPEKYKLFTSLWIFHSVPIECIIARFCKVCVAIFVFLSGYGLFKSWQKNCEFIVRERNYKQVFICHIQFVRNHLLKLMLTYWFIFIIFVPMGLFFGRKFWAVYDGNVIYGIIDVLGLADMFNTSTMNGAWWFMSAIIVLYILFPLFIRIMNFSSELMLSIAFALVFLPKLSTCPVIGKYFVWILPFVVGMYMAKYNGMERLHKHNSTMVKGLCFTAVLIVVCAWIRHFFGQTCDFDFIFALSIILFSYLVLSRIPILNIVLESFGKHSAAIFMFHTFVFRFYFQDFIYWFKYAPFIIIVLSFVCWLIAVGLERLKKVIGYAKLLKKLTG